MMASSEKYGFFRFSQQLCVSLAVYFYSSWEDCFQDSSAWLFVNRFPLFSPVPLVEPQLLQAVVL